MKTHIIPAVILTTLCVVLFSGIYTVVIWGFAQCSPDKGKGETITQNGKTYYVNIGQSFTNDRYFQSRPSAVSYNAAGSGGSNKGPSNPDYLADVQARIDSFLVHNPGITKSQIPSDLVTASSSGLDPHISMQAAGVQVTRIARIRGLHEETLMKLIEQSAEKPLFGPSVVNVLTLNLGLDQLPVNR